MQIISKQSKTYQTNKMNIIEWRNVERWEVIKWTKITRNNLIYKVNKIEVKKGSIKSNIKNKEINSVNKTS